MGSEMTQMTKLAGKVSRTTIILMLKDLTEAKNALKREMHNKYHQMRKHNAESNGSSKDKNIQYGK